MQFLNFQFVVGTRVSYRVSDNAIRYGEVIALDKRLANPSETVYTLRYFKVQVRWTHTMFGDTRIDRPRTTWIRANALVILPS